MKKSAKILVQKILIVLFTLLFGILSLATVIAMENKTLVNSALGVSDYVVLQNESAGEGTDYFPSAYGSVAEVEAAAATLSEEVEAEGAVLLTNNGVLPLAAGSKVSLFGVASADPIYGGTGSGSVKSAITVDFKQGLENAGFSVNPTLYEWYAANLDTYKGETSGLMGSGWKIGEAPWTDIETAAGTSLQEYSDAAIVILSRSGGEGADLSRTGTQDGINGDYLSLNENERQTLTALKARKDAGTLGSIIVLINAANALECDFLQDDAYGIDACLWVGTIGSTGANAIGNILSGKISPSGRLVDTYYFEHDDNPVVYQSGDFTYENAAAITGGGETNDTYFSKYVVYQEGIYVGYRYAETRYEDIVLGTPNAGDFDYASTIAYPFGYGLSYTEFTYDNMKTDYDPTSDTYTVSVTVNNIGSAASKEVVQIYAQQPYTDYDRQNGIEKASVELAGFAKTAVLQPGESETVQIEVPGSVFSSYDANNAKTYIRDAGTHYLASGKNAHDALNNILAAKAQAGITVDSEKMTDPGDATLAVAFELESDTSTYSTSSTGTVITNLFDDVDINKYDGREDNQVTYMTRSDWAGTVRTEPVTLSMTEQMFADMQYTIPEDDGDYPTYDSDETAYQLVDMIQDANGDPISYDDPAWEDLLDQLSWEDTATLCLTGLRNTAGVASIGKPATLDHNGPAGLTQSYREGKNGLAAKTNDPDKRDNPVSYPGNCIQAASFNTELLYQVGDMMGEDALWAGYSGLYGYAVNIHRSPYSGRNYEYYSEDPFLSGVMGAASSVGIQTHGVYVYTKHLALNDQETNRSGLCTWSNEQTIREIYLPPFELCISQGNAHCIMTGLNRMGVIWTSASSNLCRTLLRDEWGCDGIIITDMYNESYMNRAAMLLAGTNLPDNNGDLTLLDVYRNGYSNVAHAMRESAHRILYTVAHSNAMNGYQAGATQIVSVTPAWQKILLASDVALGILLLAALSWPCIDFFKSRRRKG